MKVRRMRVGVVVAAVAVVVLGILPLSAGRGAAKYGKMIKQMLAARAKSEQMVCVSATYGDFTMEEAYRIQSTLAGKVAKNEGAVCGYKVAYASKAAQEQFGMDEPARGPFYLTQRVPTGSSLSSGAWNEIMLETEVAFTIGRHIDKPVKNVAALKRCVKYLHPAFDAGNYPYTSDKKPTPQDMIAIGTGAHVFVLGPAVSPEHVNIDEINLGLMRNGELIRESPARNVMGSPWNSLLWCANHLVKSGKTLEPGMVVLCGTAAPAYRVKGDDIKGEYVADCGTLGKATLTIE